MQFWKEAIQGSFNKSLVAIGPVVSEEKILFKFHPPFFLICIIGQYPRWPPLLKIEISSNGQNSSILSQKVPKLELHKHNEELFNIYYGIFLIGSVGSEEKIFIFFSSPFFLSLAWRPSWLEIGITRHNFGRRPSKDHSTKAWLQLALWWPPLLKMEISSNGQNCSILSQKVPKFELYKHNDELSNIYHEIFYEL
jgi:hypothetical protein